MSALMVFKILNRILLRCAMYKNFVITSIIYLLMPHMLTETRLLVAS